MGAGAILQGLLNSATAARTGQLQGQQVANQRATQDAIQQIVQQRAMQQAELADQLKRAQINTLTNPPAKGADFHYENRSDGTYRINSLTGEAAKVGGVPGTAPTWTTFNAMVSGKPSVLKRDAQGNIADLLGRPVDPNQIAPYTPPVQSAFTFPVVDGPNGPVLAKANTKTGEVVPTDIGKSQAGAGSGGGALSGLTMQTMARMGTSFNDLSQAVDQMDRMENDPAFRAKLTAYNKALMAGAEAQPNAEAHGLGGMLSNMAGQLASGKAQQSLDPDLNTYLNLKQRVGTAFTELLPRPNQQLLQIEKGLSGIDVGWNPELLKGIQARRQGGLNVLKNILSHQGMLDENGQVSGTPTGGRGGGGGAPRQSAPPTTEQALWDAAVAKYGKQKVLQEYGPRPGGE